MQNCQPNNWKKSSPEIHKYSRIPICDSKVFVDVCRMYVGRWSISCAVVCEMKTLPILLFLRMVWVERSEMELLTNEKRIFPN